MIQWLNSYSINVPHIDKQHQELISKINAFQDACMAGKGKEIMTETLRFLKDYTIKHFGDEEREMIKHNYPGYQNQKKLHTEYIGIIGDISQKVESSGADLTAVLTLNKTLSEWLINHICKVDKQFGDFLNKK